MKKTSKSVRHTSSSRPVSHQTSRTSHSRRRSTSKAKKTQKSSHSFMRQFLFIAACLVVIMASYTFIESITDTPSVVEAEERLSDIQYKVVEIKYGDTLWSIAEENMSPGYTCIDEYIDEIKECNQLYSDQIIDGNYLMIPYYEVLQSGTIVVSNN